jgi:DNA-binding MarR family transcriptional regulator
MEQQSSVSIAQQLGRSLMELNKVFWQAHRETIHQLFAGCNPSDSRMLFMIRGMTEALGRAPKVSDLSKAMHVTSPSVTQVIKSLEASGLVERRIDPNDRRAVCLVLTEHGESFVQKVNDIFIASSQELIDYLGEEQSNQLIELLIKAKGYFEEKEKKNASFTMEWS